jgi:predicted CoA-binding protein
MDAKRFDNPSLDEIEARLQEIQTIAIVGLSENPMRPSHGVARALQQFGYRIIPITPASDRILGEHCFASLDAAVAQVGATAIDLVDVFRRSEHVAAIVDDCIRLKLRALWLQDGVIDPAAAARARDAGVFTVMDRCIYRDRARLA